MDIVVRPRLVSARGEAPATRRSGDEVAERLDSSRQAYIAWLREVSSAA